MMSKDLLSSYTSTSAMLRSYLDTHFCSYCRFGVTQLQKLCPSGLGYTFDQLARYEIWDGNEATLLVNGKVRPQDMENSKPIGGRATQI